VTDTTISPATGARQANIATHACLAAVFALAATLRIPGMTTLGLWRDDAWSALTSRVGLTQALRMSTTTPGFSLLVRSWVGLHPDSSVWAQMLPYVIGLVGIFAVFTLLSIWGLPRWLGLLGAFVVAMSPVCVQYSTHVKQFSTDLLLSCLVLATGETTRRSPTVRKLVGLAATCCFAVFVSASVLPIVAGAWGAMLLSGIARKSEVVRIAGAGGAVGLFITGLYAAFWRDLPPVLHDYWIRSGTFIRHSSFASFRYSLGRTMSALTVGLIAPAGRLTTLGDLSWPSHRLLIPAIVLFTLAAIGMTAGHASLACAIALLAAFGASLVGLAPLGTGRTDEAIYPPLIVLAALGVHQLGKLWVRALPSAPEFRKIGAGLATVSSLVFVGYSVIASDVRRHPPRYPEAAVQELAGKIQPQLLPGDRILVDPYTRYPWALYEEPRVDVVFGKGWGTGFSVKTTRPDTFISPTETWEKNYTPGEWATNVATAGRLWYFGTFYLSRQYDPILRALTDQGWQPQQQFESTGTFALLLTDGGVPADKLLQQGLDFDQQGRTDEAANRYEAATGKDPTNFYAYYNLGVIASTRGLTGPAIDFYEKSLAINPNFRSALYNLGLIYSEKQPDEAIGVFRRLLTVDPDDPNIEVRLGRLLVQRGQAAEGNALVRKALKSDPSLAALAPPPAAS
jgi:tetratricopeptide (TPR) repeat protein